MWLDRDELLEVRERVGGAEGVGVYDGSTFRSVDGVDVYDRTGVLTWGEGVVGAVVRDVEGVELRKPVRGEMGVTRDGISWTDGTGVLSTDRR